MEDTTLREIALRHAVDLAKFNGWTLSEVLTAARDIYDFLVGPAAATDPPKSFKTMAEVMGAPEIDLNPEHHQND